jgi:shikimate kinase
MRIYLIGMPGSGKSTLGKSLATLLHLTFIDLDDRIISMEGMPISEVFSQKGETYFRQIERAALLQTCNENDIVVATGGGTPCFFDNIELINQYGISIFLNIPLELLARRISPEKSKKQMRPLFAGKSPQELIETLSAMWEKRISFYQKACIHIAPEEAKAEIVVYKIKNNPLYKNV